MLEKAFAGYLIRNRKNIGTALLSVVGGIVFLILLIPTVLFGGGFDEKDSYQRAWEKIECSNDTIVILEDIRAMESYVDPDSFEYISKEEASNRLNAIYLDANYDKEHKKICLLKDQDMIVNNLKNRYVMSDEQMEEMLELVEQVRNGRQYFHNPVKNGLLGRRFGADIEGWIIKGSKGAEVTAVADGEIVDMKTLSDMIPYESGYHRGLTVKIKHTLQQGIGDDGEYRIKVVYGKYSMLSSVSLSVGDEVKQGQQIGSMANEVMLFEILDESGNKIDPQYFMYIGSENGELKLPFDLPITITSEVGGRELDNYHYGMDMVKAVDQPIRVLANGEIVSVNSTCAPYGGKLGNFCPVGNSISGGGNYVQIKFDYHDDTYYATYMHMAKVNVQVGDIVHFGDIIGTQGNSGNSSGSHLHLEIHKGTKAVSTKDGLMDPKEMLDFNE